MNKKLLTGKEQIPKSQALSPAHTCLFIIVCAGAQEGLHLHPHTQINTLLKCANGRNHVE